MSNLAKLAEEKVNQAKAAQKTEEQRLALAQEENHRLQLEHDARMVATKEQDRRLQAEHEARVEEERKQNEQRNRIVNLWTEYQSASKEPNLIKRFLAIKTLISADTTFDVSAVKESDILDHYTELCTGIKSLLNIIKEKLVMMYFSYWKTHYLSKKDFTSYRLHK